MCTDSLGSTCKYLLSCSQRRPCLVKHMCTDSLGSTCKYLLSCNQRRPCLVKDMCADSLGSTRKYLSSCNQRRPCLVKDMCADSPVYMHVRIQRGDRGSGPPTPLKNHKNIGFHINTCPDPLKKHKATKPAFNVGPTSARQRNTI